jgi:DnaJ-class molecular chaperone
MHCSALLLLLIFRLATSTASSAPSSSTSTDKNNFYTLLEVSTRATPNEIKKAYRRKALKWHPDKNPKNKEEAEVMFRNIAEAYEVLSDPSARKQYDAYGRDDGGGGWGGFGRKKGGMNKHRRSAEDIFTEAFGGKDPFANMAEFFDSFEEEEIIYDPAVAATAATAADSKLESELLLFYQNNKPEKANVETIRKLMNKYQTPKLRKKLFRRLKKKYKDDKISLSLRNMLLSPESGSSGKREKTGMFSGVSFSYSTTTTTTNSDGTSYSSSFSNDGEGKTVKKTITNDGRQTIAEEEVSESGRTRKRTGRKRNDGGSLETENREIEL